jgi:hypothetical protein
MRTPARQRAGEWAVSLGSRRSRLCVLGKADHEQIQRPKTVMRYDHGRENLDQNAVNFLAYDDEEL